MNDSTSLARGPTSLENILHLGSLGPCSAFVWVSWQRCPGAPPKFPLLHLEKQLCLELLSPDKSSNGRGCPWGFRDCRVWGGRAGKPPGTPPTHPPLPAPKTHLSLWGSITAFFQHSLSLLIPFPVNSPCHKAHRQ